MACLVVAVSIVGCASSPPPPVCSAGRTNVDGVCVSEKVADYVACVRAQGAQLGDDRSRRLAAEVEYLGAKASTVSDVKERLEKKYSVGADAEMEIVRTCGAASGMASSPARSSETATDERTYLVSESVHADPRQFLWEAKVDFTRGTLRAPDGQALTPGCLPRDCPARIAKFIDVQRVDGDGSSHVVFKVTRDDAYWLLYDWKRASDERSFTGTFTDSNGKGGTVRGTLR